MMLMLMISKFLFHHAAAVIYIVIKDEHLSKIFCHQL